VKFKYDVGDKVVLRNDPMLMDLNGAEVTIKAQQSSDGIASYLVSTGGNKPISNVLWEGHISGASAGTKYPAILEEMTHPQLTRAGLGTVVSDEYGHVWVKIAGGKWAGGSKEVLQILSSKGLWEKFISLELRKEGL
jgi:hypothetical protein